MSIRIDGVSKRFGPQEIFRNFSLDIAEGAITCILGPSGCGKTTLLRMIAGLLRPDGGTVPARDTEQIGYVFQEPRLLPWKTARDNVAYVMGRTAPTDADRSHRLLEAVELGGAADLYPHELSGGMARRVALARAFAASGPLLLMDEPFASLDRERKRRLVSVVTDLLADRRRTVVCATHDLEVAATLADRVLIFSRSPVHILGDIARGPSSDTTRDRIERVLEAARVDLTGHASPSHEPPS